MILLCCNKGLCSRQNWQQTLPEGRTETFTGQEAADLSTPACTLSAVGDPCLEASKQTSLREACQPSTCSVPISRLCLSRKHTHRVCAWLPDLGTVKCRRPMPISSSDRPPTWKLATRLGEAGFVCCAENLDLLAHS